MNLRTPHPLIKRLLNVIQNKELASDEKVNQVKATLDAIKKSLDLKKSAWQKDKEIYEELKQLNSEDQFNISLEEITAPYSLDVVENEYTLLSHALETQQIEIVKLLLDAKADPSFSTKEAGSHPLNRAALLGHVPIIQLLLESHANVNQANPETGSHPLSCAACKGHIEAADVLLQAKADIELADHYGCTPLYYGIQSGQIHTTRFLLEKKANIYFDKQIPALSVAAATNLELVNLILEAKADPRYIDSNGVTAIWYAVGNGKISTAEKLLQFADINFVYKDKGTLLFISIRKKQHEMTKWLLGKGAEPDLGEDGYHPLWQAALSGDADAVTLLLDAKVSPNKQFGRNVTPIVMASQQGHLNVVTLLLERKADPHVVSRIGSPLAKAAQCGHKEVVLKLLEAKVDINQTAKRVDTINFTALQIAILSKCFSAIDILLSLGAKLNNTGQFGAGELFKKLMDANQRDPHVINCLTMLHQRQKLLKPDGYHPNSPHNLFSQDTFEFLGSHLQKLTRLMELFDKQVETGIATGTGHILLPPLQGLVKQYLSFQDYFPEFSSDEIDEQLTRLEQQEAKKSPRSTGNKG